MQRSLFALLALSSILGSFAAPIWAPARIESRPDVRSIIHIESRPGVEEALEARAIESRPDVRAIGITSVSAATTATFRPFTFYAATGYCKSKDTLTWKCGKNCNANPTFQPTASGGNGITSQFCEFIYLLTIRC
jgi:hypothetical protein